MSDFRYWLRASYTAMTASVLFLFSSSAAAEEDDSTNDYFEEVIVTAERTAKSVMDTSMTITGFSEDTLKKFGIQDLSLIHI